MVGGTPIVDTIVIVRGGTVVPGTVVPGMTEVKVVTLGPTEEPGPPLVRPGEVPPDVGTDSIDDKKEPPG